MLYQSTCVGLEYGLYDEGYFLDPSQCIINPLRQYIPEEPSLPHRLGNINPTPIHYASQPRVRNRLTLRRLALRRNPWIFGDTVSRGVFRYSCQHSHFRYLQITSRLPFAGLRNAPLPLIPYDMNPQFRYMILAPLHLRRRTAYLDQ